jgi:hypothetical protein
MPEQMLGKSSETGKQTINAEPFKTAVRSAGEAPKSDRFTLFERFTLRLPKIRQSAMELGELAEKKPERHSITTKQALLTGIGATAVSFGIQAAIFASQNPFVGGTSSFFVNATAQALGLAHNLVPAASPVLVGVEGMLLSLGIGAATTTVLTYLAHRNSKKSSE